MKTPRYRVFKSRTSSVPVFSTNWKLLAKSYVSYFCKNNARIEKFVGDKYQTLLEIAYARCDHQQLGRHCMIWFASSLVGHSRPFSFSRICRSSAGACFKLGRLALCLGSISQPNGNALRLTQRLKNAWTLR